MFPHRTRRSRCPGQYKVINVKGSEFVLAADMVLDALGEGPDISSLPEGKIVLPPERH